MAIDAPSSEGDTVRSPSDRRQPGRKSLRGISVTGHDPAGSGNLLIRSPRWAGRRQPPAPRGRVACKALGEEAIVGTSHTRSEATNVNPASQPQTSHPRYSQEAVVVGAAVAAGDASVELDDPVDAPMSCQGVLGALWAAALSWR